LTKKKLDQHRNRCYGATFTCIDCMVHFPGTQYRSHTSCMSEEQKYQGALYRGDKKGKQNNNNNNAGRAPPAQPAMVQPAYVEDVPDELVPTPPAAADNVNVFDFLMATTPAASTVNLPATAPIPVVEETQLVRFDPEANATAETLDRMETDSLVHYGTGSAPTSFATPAPKSLRKKSDKSERDVKKDKKRKRLHIETDQAMTDAPPVTHSGLTGGLSRMSTRPAFPPSPDLSGDAAETPTSPLKKSKSKHSKSSRSESIGNSLMAMIAASTKPAKTKKTKSSSTLAKKEKKVKKDKKSSTKRLEAPSERKLLEYRPDGAKGAKEGDNASGQMVIYKPRAEHFLSFVNKGPGSERGCSVNKALKRFHRERAAPEGEVVSKFGEEKELWRSLRMKKNDRGEIVLFCI